MATPVGHALCGVLVGTLVTWSRPLLTPWRDVAIFVVFAMGPDLDFLPGILIGKPDVFHHGPSHSITFAVLVGVLIWLWARWRDWDSPWRWGLCGGLIYLVQVVIDMLNADTKAPFGVPLFWPFYDGYLMLADPWFGDVRRHPLNWATMWHNIKLVGLETLIWGVPAAIALWIKNRRGAAVPGTGKGA